MALSKVANRYAQSFLDTSIEKKNLTEIGKDFELVYATLTKSVDLLRAIKSPIIKAETKKEILSKIFEKLINKDSMSFLDFTITKGREKILLEILEKFESLKDEYTGFVKIDVTTAFEFTSEQKTQLQEKFESYLKKKSRLTFKVDENIIGGFIAKVGDTIYNASMAHQLGLLKKTFLQSSITLN